ncbi:hypothetical protein [Cesiribacter andamanensis]|uniref:Class I SAM-dependent methyltransferase n=1 Tax=Cesiribacter andamanensis AMV16 TaxID=1279009 RepID=M7N9P4_9BACT|nr:hypothetical protein [Cesiribacter andamanensis]EMR03992.1 hypothetical protein ADICEAN_00863 [Cesiribacter andamanensis AMV16]
MKRIHLFEFEDQAWFPDWLRQRMLRLLQVLHRLLGTAQALTPLLNRALQHSAHPALIDLCSGSGGPMLEAHARLRQQAGLEGVTLTLTDLYPNQALANQLRRQGDPAVVYLPQPVDATSVPPGLQGVRTMVSSLHHMKPRQARAILADALEKKQALCVLEISDNRFPIALWWVALPFNLLTALLLAPLARPLDWRLLVFTYLIPLIPICFAWDGAVSNARTYTLEDLEKLLEGLQRENYRWEMGKIPGRSAKVYLLGLPQQNRA